MSRTTRWLAGAASVGLLLGFVAPATGHADEAVAAATNHAGPCVGDTGVTVVLDYQALGGGTDIRCSTGTPETGVDAVRAAGFTYDGVARWGDAFACRLNGRPSADEVIPLTGNPTYTEKCVNTPPANGYWSYWHSTDQGQEWEYSNMGGGGYEPSAGEWEGWSFSLNATASSNPEPRTALALAEYDNTASTALAADWIASQWDASDDQFAAGLADSISALAAAGSHPEVVSEMVHALQGAAPEYIDQADSLAKVLIALDMTGQDTNHFLSCDRDLTAELDAFIANDARSLDNWWGPHLVTIALNRLGKPVPQNVWDLLAKRQGVGGGFGSPDDTGLALSALVGTSENELNTQSMRDAADAAIDKAVAWADDPANQKTKDGNYYWATFAAANSTGILAGGLAEAGEDIASPQAFMRGQQNLTGVGAWQNKLDRTSANYMATAQGIFAVAGRSYGKSTLEVPRITSTCSVKPAFSTQPSSTTVIAGENATFTVAATGDPTPGITWEKDISGLWTPIQGVTGTTLTLDKVGSDSNGLRVRAVAANAAGYAVSKIATLTVTPVVSPSPSPSPSMTTSPSASPSASPSPSVTPTVPSTVYNTPGYHDVNGRKWFTTCEPYSVTQRCRTLIEATTVRDVGGKFVSSKGWAFNNLTYLPSPKAAWKGNRLAETGTWTAADGRQWRTECGTPATGRNGCRSYIQAKVVENVAKPGESVR
ncbi:MAG: immunoglobulin domain-containing protein, partial [Arachnia sp.]